MIQLQDILLKRGNKELFSHLTVTVHARHRVGIVGRNGVGKTSLFLLVRGRLFPEEGEVKVPKDWVIAHLDQEIAPSERSALDWVIDGDEPLRSIERGIAAADARGEHAELATLYAKLETIDGYTAQARAGEILHGLGFESEDFGKPVADFSGGWRIRLNLAQTLMCRSDLLLLDEPTNHLDLDAAMWLEQWLVKHPGTSLVISHDRDFLDRVVTDIVHLERGRARSYRGSYSSFELQRSEQLAREQALHEKQQRRVAEIRTFVNRFKAKASKARQAQSRLKELSRMELIVPAHVDSPYRFSFPSPEKVSNPLLDMEEAMLGYGGEPVLADVRLRLQAGDRVGLLGKNGAGKSTLIRSIAGELMPMCGKFERGRHAAVGYFAQHTMETLVARKTPLAHLQELDAKATEQAIRNYLGGWGFPGEMALGLVGTLSGGEKARLALAVIAWTKPALLLLDEPTNHLDLDMRHALTLALQAYEGALVLVSHDRHLLENTVDELWLVAEHRVRHFEGDLDEYGEWLLGGDDRGKSARAVDDKSRGARRRESALKREQTKPLRDALRDVERKIGEIEPKLRQITDELADTETYQRLTSEEVSDLIIRHKRYRERLDRLEEEWLALSERLEAATA